MASSTARAAPAQHKHNDEQNDEQDDRRSVSGEVLFLLADTISESISGPLRKWDLFQLTAEQISIIGSESLGVISASGIATGAVMALQFGAGLQRFGGTLYVPELVGLSVFRELGPVLVSLLLAGRVGSGITSELASMNVSEQIDAIRVLGDSPNATLVMPRLLACLISFPILTLFGDVISVLSSMLVSWLELSIKPTFYLAKTVQSLVLADIWTGMVKSVVFALFIAMFACWKGLNTRGGTRGVGMSTTWIVVRSSIFILVSDYFLSKLFIMTVLKHAI
jgi:phospholipid/cholesterol/gamma-HCH transport system permease protein